jgi:ATP-binding cassette subfamily F protein uup
MLLRLDQVSLSFGSRPLLDHITLQVDEGERVCVVGRNGEGKSSLLRLVAGEIAPDDGSVWTNPGARVAYLVQDVTAATDDTVEAVVAAASELAADQEPWEREQRVRVVTTQLGLDGDARFAALSGGWRRRVLLARALVSEPQVLLLDEPTNHLDIEAIEWLEQVMLEFRGALLFVSHDRAFINRLATRVIELDRGALSSWPGNFDQYRERKAEQLAIEAQHAALFDKLLAREEVWIRKGVEARRTRNEGRVRALEALRKERRARRERPGQAALALQEFRESGRKVFEAEDASVAFGERTIIRGLTVTIGRGDRIGIVGPNGAGKSTLLRLLLGELPPATGRVEIGTKLQVAYYDQQRAQLKLDKSVMENVSERSDQVIVNGQTRHVSGYLRDFLFRPEQLRTPASALSGGERNRLLLARLFASPANLLVLDEPTNDLDIETLELLEELVCDFDGTLLLVSHDRAFLDRVVTSLLVVSGDGSVTEFVGGYSDWLVDRNRRLAQGAAVAVSASATDARSAPKPPATRRAERLSYKEQRELDALPAEIAALEAEQSRCADEVNDPKFYQRARAETAAALETLRQLGERIERAYARWAELEGKTSLAGSSE